MPDNPWAGIQNIGAIDQKLYQPPQRPAPVPASEMSTQREKKVVKSVKPKAAAATIEEKPVERKQQQLNAWITVSQNDILDQVYFGLRAKGMKQLKKGELVGVAIEVLAEILEQYSPKEIDSSLLDNFLAQYEKKAT